MGMQNVSFGALTKSVHQLNFQDLDIDKDGIITQEELDAVIEKGGFDVLDISGIDKDADQKVTQEEYVLWQQEAEMNEYLETLKTQAAKDLVGQSPDDIKKMVDMLTDFEAEFKEEYTKTHKNLSGMSAKFMQELSKKYVEFKKDVLSNTKTAVVSRVINNVIADFMEKDKMSGNSFLSMIDNKASSLSDNANRLLTNELSREAERFIKKYDGENLESDLAAYLKQYLNKTDKEKLADAIGVWEKGKQEVEELPDDLRFSRLKAKAKNLLVTALDNDISLKLGDVYVRSSSAIPAALGQFKDIDTLKHSVDKAIHEVSVKTRAQQIKEKEEEKKAAAVEKAYKEFQKEEQNKNIFM